MDHILEIWQQDSRNSCLDNKLTHVQECVGKGAESFKEYTLQKSSFAIRSNFFGTPW